MVQFQVLDKVPLDGLKVVNLFSEDVILSFDVGPPKSIFM